MPHPLTGRIPVFPAGYEARPADGLISALAVVTHTNMSPGVQGSGSASTNPYGPTGTAGWVGLLADLGIRRVRDDSTIDLANLKGGDPTTTAAIAHQLACYQTLQSLGIRIGTECKTPQAIMNLVTQIIPFLAQPLDWVETLNEEASTYAFNPGSWTQYTPPAPYDTAGWGTLANNGHWALGVAYPKGAVITGGGSFPGDAVISASATTTSGSPTVACAAAAASWVGMFVSGPGIPSPAYIDSVSAGVSFHMTSTPGGAATNATANGTNNVSVGGLAYGGTWYCATAHTSAYATHPDQIVCAGNGGGAGSTGGQWFDETQGGPWVPMWSAHCVLLTRLLANLRAQGLIPKATLISSDAASNDIAHNTLIAASTTMLGGPSCGADLMQTHNYGTGNPSAAAVVHGQLSAVGATATATAANRLKAYSASLLGENGAASNGDNGANELSVFTNLAHQMIDAYRLGMYHMCCYELTDYNLAPGVAGAWPSPIDFIPGGTAVGGWPGAGQAVGLNTICKNGSWYFRCTAAGTTGGVQPAQFSAPPAYGATFADNTVTWKYIGQWETYGLASLNNTVLNGTVANDFRKKNGWSYLKNLIAAIADPGSQPAPSVLDAAIGGLASLYPPLVLNRRNGQYDIVLSSSTGAAVAGVTINPAPAGGSWHAAALIDPSVSSAPSGSQSNITAGAPYTVTVPLFPIVVRITP